MCSSYDLVCNNYDGDHKKDQTLVMDREVVLILEDHSNSISNLIIFLL